MRKKDLLALPLMKVTEEMRRAAGETQKYERWRMTDIVGPKYQKYFRARKTGNVLEIAVFEWGRIQAGDDEPIFRIFLHDGKYNTWDAYKQKWRTASIEHLYDSEYQTRAERAAHGTYWYKERDRQLIVKFTKSKHQDIPSAVLEWQQYEKNRGETEIIDAAMSLVPETPKSFAKWVETDALPQYMYYESGRKIGLCTSCGKYHELKEPPKYGETGICPGCKRKVQYKTYKKCPRFQERAYASLIQKTPDGYVLRHFCLWQDIKKGKRKDVSIWEQIRITYDKHWQKKSVYSYHRYKQTNTIRWCNGYQSDYWSGYKEEEKSALYPRNLKRILKGTELEYSGLQEFACTGIEFYQQNFIDTARRFVGLEKLIKVGYLRLAQDCMDYRELAPINLKEKRVKKVLRLNGEYYNQIKGKDPSWNEYRTVYWCQEAGVRMTWEQIQEMSRIQRNFAVYMKYTTPYKMIKYIRIIQTGKEGVLKEYQCYDYHDYLQMAAGLGYNMKDEWVLYPKNLSERHDQLIKEQKEKEEQLEKQKDDEKDESLRTTIKEHDWNRYEMETEDLLIRLPEYVHEIREEGNAQHHCVATYMDRMIAGETCILFIRKKEEQDKSYYTVEVRDDEVIQVRGKYNVAPSEDVEEFMKVFKKNIRKAERKAS